jgi:hypothetical protein
VRQFQDVALDEKIRLVRVLFLWEVFEYDEMRRDEILNYFIVVLNGECKSHDHELCQLICNSYPKHEKVIDDLMKRLLKIDDKYMLDKFFH